MRKFDQYNAPEKYRPMSGWGFYWWSVLYSIPIIGFIFLLINACDPSNLCRRSHARSYFCGFFLVVMVLGAIAGILHLSGKLDGAIETIMQFISTYIPSGQ